MNWRALRVAMAKVDINIPKLAEKMGIDKSILYSRFNGTTSFKQPEIAKISEILELDDDSILTIFFDRQVS